ncbi:MAG: hypothetical protein ACRD97_07655, partial [Nitrososphaeraceae archaeon]
PQRTCKSTPIFQDYVCIIQQNLTFICKRLKVMDLLLDHPMVVDLIDMFPIQLRFFPSIFVTPTWMV